MRELLETYDDPVYAEQPPGFDRLGAEADFLVLVKALEAALGRELKAETADHIQDASFHGQVFVPGDGGMVFLRCSNFGRMATVGPERYLSSDELATIRAVLETLSYVFVPDDLLMQPYTGPNPGVTGIKNWYHRYFDWI